MEYVDRHQGGERTILVSVSVQLLDDLDAEEFALLAQSRLVQIFLSTLKFNVINRTLSFYWFR